MMRKRNMEKNSEGLNERASMWPVTDLDPVVQSIVSLMSLLVVKMLTVLVPYST